MTVITDPSGRMAQLRRSNKPFHMLGILSGSEIEELLEAASIGRLACRSGDDILILPLAFRYYEGCAWCHSFEGTKIEWMRTNRHVGFETDRIEDGRNWKSVVAQGIFEELSAPEEIETAKHILRKSWLGDKSSLTALPPAETPSSPHQPAGPSVFFRIRLFNITGRFEQSPLPINR